MSAGIDVVELVGVEAEIAVGGEDARQGRSPPRPRREAAPQKAAAVGRRGLSPRISLLISKTGSIVHLAPCPEIFLQAFSYAFGAMIPLEKQQVCSTGS